MSRTPQHSLRQQSGKTSSQAGFTIPLQIAMTLAEARKGLYIRQIEAVQAAVSENLQYCKAIVEKMADTSSLFELWTELCQRKAHRYGDLTYAYFGIMSQNAAELSHLLSESLSDLRSTIQSTTNQNMAPIIERRTTSKVISFPDRRIATASVLMQAHSGNSGLQSAAQRSSAA